MMCEFACAILLALLPACGFLVLARPAFAGLLGIAMGLLDLIQLFVVCGTGVMGLMLFVGLMLFGRLSHSAIRPLSERKTGGQAVLRRAAVTLQLAVSVVFLVAALVVMLQMRFVNHKDLGFDRQGIIQLSGFLDYSGRVQTALMHELEAIPQVENLTDAYFEPQHNANPLTTTTEVEWPGKSPDEKLAFHFILTDSRFAETFGLKMRMGAWWDEGKTQKIVLNEEAVRVMGLSEPVGATIRMPSLYDNAVMEKYEVAGVVRDFHTLSLRNRIHPTLFIPSPELNNILYIRTPPGLEQEAMRRITAILPGIDATLADVRLRPVGELYDRFNQSEQAGLKMFSVLAAVCLLISLFGIYAVATASTRRRRKEVAIRKVMGAKAGDIVRLFFREYAVQVVIAGLVALPPVYLAMSRWLQGYAYRTNIPWWLLTGVMAGVAAVILLTVLGQVLKAASGNPAEVVKSE
jgi:putative ABC transport system permease protein